MIRFGRETCGNLAIAQTREWLIANGIGGFACGTISGMLTRRYHGLLIAALDPPLNRTLLLAQLDETVLYQDYNGPIHIRRHKIGRLALSRHHVAIAAKEKNH